MQSVQSPVRTRLPREVLQWTQNLQLTHCPNNVRRDFSNGFLVADIFSRFYPKVFLLYSYQNGSSLSIKRENWRRIEESLQKLNVHLSRDLINGTIHLETGAAERLLVEIYTILTKQSPYPESSERQYNELVPTIAPSTVVSGGIRTTQSDLDTDKKNTSLQRVDTERTRTGLCSSSRSQSSVSFKEIRVNQPIRRFIQQ